MTLSKSLPFPFPPCTGGCIGFIKVIVLSTLVSSLYGRVYRNTTIYCFKKLEFPPCMGGCIDMHEPMVEIIEVSSLYGRVYR